MYYRLFVVHILLLNALAIMVAISTPTTNRAAASAIVCGPNGIKCKPNEMCDNLAPMVPGGLWKCVTPDEMCRPADGKRFSKCPCSVRCNSRANETSCTTPISDCNVGCECLPGYRQETQIADAFVCVPIARCVPM